MADPVKADDSDEKWEGYPGHTRAKHELFAYYLDIWFRKLGHDRRKLRVFDCFAGRAEYYGENEDEPLELSNISTPASYPGSPQLVLDTAVERAENVGEVECIFIEKKGKNAGILRDNLPADDELPNNVEYNVIEGKFQEATLEAAASTGGWSDPCFFFIDPFGYKPLDYDVVTKLSSTDQFEILVNLMASEVHRWQDAEKHHSALQQLFGTESWHSELERHEPEHWNDKEVSYYCERLRANGPEHTRAFLVTEEDTEAMKYYLVFGTNSEHGVQYMHETMQNCGTGEFAYAPERPELDQEQRDLFAVTQEQERERLKEQLTEQFSGQTVTFEEMARTFVTEKEYTTSQTKDIRAAAKKLESVGDITVQRVTSSTPQGLGGKDEITFP